ncbi:MAG TPA: hypothetical protein VJ505_13855 [Holophagaceae bacterium]|nr:hypothetical protein [Holophagaceae bacterium]
MHVKGIGEKGYQRIKAYLRVAHASGAEQAPVVIPAAHKPTARTTVAKSGAKR